MKEQIERARRGLWTFKQPLTRVPAQKSATVSDLFVWRSSASWRTYFELIDVCGLFLGHTESHEREVRVFFFDQNGVLIQKQSMDLLPNQRRTVELSGLPALSGREYGTFCIFHSSTPKTVSDWGSFIAERGYVSYRYRDAPLRSYVHGNLDAVALNSDSSLDLLGSRSLRTREYRLQHELHGRASYELALVNPSKRNQRIDCHVFSKRSRTPAASYSVQLPPLGCHIFQLDIDRTAGSRVVIESHLVMARPVVFRIQDRTADVFHG